MSARMVPPPPGYEEVDRQPGMPPPPPGYEGVSDLALSLAQEGPPPPAAVTEESIAPVRGVKALLGGVRRGAQGMVGSTILGDVAFRRAMGGGSEALGERARALLERGTGVAEPFAVVDEEGRPIPRAVPVVQRATPPGVVAEDVILDEQQLARAARLRAAAAEGAPELGFEASLGRLAEGEVGPIAEWAGNAVGNVLPYAAAAVPLTMAGGPVGPLAAGVSMYPLGVGEVYGRQLEEGRDQPLKALGIGVPYAAVEVLPEVKLARLLSRTGKRGLRATADVAEMGLRGGAEETAQTAMERMGAGLSLSGPEASAEMREAFAAGAVGEGALGAGGVGVRRLLDRVVGRRGVGTRDETPVVPQGVQAEPGAASAVEPSAEEVRPDRDAPLPGGASVAVESGAPAEARAATRVLRAVHVAARQMLGELLPEGSYEYAAEVSEAAMHEVALAREVARSYGHSVVLVRPTSERADVWNGLSLPDGRIVVNVNASNPLQFVVGHELVEQIGKVAPDLMAPLLAVAGELADLEGYRQANEVRGGEVGREWVADITSEYLYQPHFWELLVERSPRLFRQMAREFIRVLQRVRQWVREVTPLYQATPWLRDAERAQTMVAEMLTAYRDVRRTPAELAAAKVEARATAAHARASRAAERRRQREARETDAVWLARKAFARHKVGNTWVGGIRIPPKGGWKSSTGTVLTDIYEELIERIPLRYRAPWNDQTAMSYDEALVRLDQLLGVPEGTSTLDDLAQVLKGRYRGPGADAMSVDDELALDAEMTRRDEEEKTGAVQRLLRRAAAGETIAEDELLGDRRRDPARRQRVAEMSSDERAVALLTDEATGLPNLRAWSEEDLGPHKAVLDLDNFGGINELLGHAGGDAAVAAVGRAARAAGVRLYRVARSGAGDEFALHGSSLDEVRAALVALRNELRSSTFEVEREDGTIETWGGLDFSSGLGVRDDLVDADEALRADKAERGRAGLRAIPTAERPRPVSPLLSRIASRKQVAAGDDARRDSDSAGWESDRTDEDVEPPAGEIPFQRKRSRDAGYLPGMAPEGHREQASLFGLDEAQLEPLARPTVATSTRQGPIEHQRGLFEEQEQEAARDEVERRMEERRRQTGQLPLFDRLSAAREQIPRQTAEELAGEIERLLRGGVGVYSPSITGQMQALGRLVEPAVRAANAEDAGRFWFAHRQGELNAAEYRTAIATLYGQDGQPLVSRAVPAPEPEPPTRRQRFLERVRYAGAPRQRRFEDVAQLERRHTSRRMGDKLVLPRGWNGAYPDRIVLGQATLRKFGRRVDIGRVAPTYVLDGNVWVVVHGEHDRQTTLIRLTQLTVDPDGRRVWPMSRPFGQAPVLVGEVGRSRNDVLLRNYLGGQPAVGGEPIDEARGRGDIVKDGAAGDLRRGERGAAEGGAGSGAIAGVRRGGGSRVSEGADEIPFQRKRSRDPGPIWYSKLQRVIEERLPNRASADQVRGVLGMRRSPDGEWQSGIVKPEEIVWSGIEEYLAEHPQVVKSELLDALRASQVEVREVVHAAQQADRWLVSDGIETRAYDSEREAEEVAEWWTRSLLEDDEAVRRSLDPDEWSIEPNPYAAGAGDSFVVRDWNGDIVDVVGSRERAEAVIARNTERQRERVLDTVRVWRDDELVDSVKYRAHQLPGGENYRELLLTLPTQYTGKSKTPDTTGWTAFDRGDGMWIVQDNTGRARSRGPEAIGLFSAESQAEAIRQAAAERSRGVAQQPFLSDHWDEPNVLVHVRFNERTDADGRRVLFIEEIQSDWHQEGRKKGYRGDFSALEAEILAAAARNRADVAEVQRAINHLTDGALDTEQRPTDWAWEYLHNATRDSGIDLNRFHDIEDKGVPSAPFKKSWPELAMKRMIRWAAEQGFDRVAWTPGAVQFDRWGSEEIAWVRDGDAWRVRATQQRGGHAGGIDLEGEARARGLLKESPGTTVYDKEGLLNVARHVLEGDHSADQIRKIVERTWERMQTEDAGTSMPRKEGMEEFYDSRSGIGGLVVVANKLAKRFGARVGTTEITPTEDPYTHSGIHVDESSRELMRRRGNLVRVHFLDITPEMQESVLGGQAMFQRKRSRDRQPPTRIVTVDTSGAPRRPRRDDPRDTGTAPRPKRVRQAVDNARQPRWAADEQEWRRAEENREQAELQEREGGGWVPPPPSGQDGELWGPEEWDERIRGSVRTLDSLGVRIGRVIFRSMQGEFGEEAPARSLRRLGRAGEEVFQRIERAWRKQVGWRSDRLEPMWRAWKALPKHDRRWARERFLWAYEDGERMPSRGLEELARAWREANEWVGRKGEELGVRVWYPEDDVPRPFTMRDPRTYVPHRLTEEAYDALQNRSGRLYQALINELRVQGIPLEIVWQLTNPSYSVRHYGSLEHPRLAELPRTLRVDGREVKILEDGLELLGQHLTAATRRLAVVEEFGNAGSATYLQALQDRLVAHGMRAEHAAATLAWSWQRLQGRERAGSPFELWTAGRRVWAVVEAMTAAANLSLAVLPNLIGGPAPMVVRHGVKAAAKAFAHAWTTSLGNASEQELRALGYLHADLTEALTGRDLMAGMPSTEYVERLPGAAAKRLLRTTGFHLVNRKINQAVAHAMARYLFRHYLDLVARDVPAKGLARWRGENAEAARRRLVDEMGFSEDDVRRMVLNGPTREDMQRAVLREIEAVNAMFESPASAPPRVHTFMWRLLFAYSTYTRKFARTVEWTVDEARRGHVVPLLRLLTFGTATGAAIRAVRDLLKDREREDEGFWRRLAENLAEVGAAGIWSGAFYALRHFGEAGHELFGDVFAPPQTETLSRVVDGVAKVVGEGELKPLWKAVLMTAPLADVIEKQTFRDDPEYLADRLSRLVYTRPGRNKDGTRRYALDPKPARPRTAQMLLDRWRELGYTDEELLQRMQTRRE